MEYDLLINGGAIFVLLLFSAFLSGSETALTAASRARLYRMMQEPESPALGRRARLATRLTERRERLIGAILLGNNLVNILASALATGVFIGLFGDAGILYATLAMTMLVLIFAEVLPKTWAIADPDRTALTAAPLISGLVFVLGPVVRAVQAVVRGILRLFGIDIDRRQSILSAQERIRDAIAFHTEKGAMVKHERDMLAGILDLAEVEVSEIMVHRRKMVMLDAGEAPAAIIEKVVASPHTRFPLWRENPDNVIGILHAKDVLRATREHRGAPDDLDVAAIASPPLFVPETTSLREQLNVFRRKRAHIGIVVDEYGALMGLVTMEDILEEIVGDIADEHDLTTEGVHQRADGTVVVEGTVTVRDLNRQFDWSLPDEAAATVAGLIIDEARTIPEPRQTFSFHGFKFEILRRWRNQITLIRITPPRLPPAPGR